MQKYKFLTLSIALLLFVTACATQNPQAVITPERSSLFTRFTDEDREKLHHVLQSVPSYETFNWVNSQNQQQYFITPLPVFKEDHKVCRKARLVQGKNKQQSPQEIQACRQNGAWIILADN